MALELGLPLDDYMKRTTHRQHLAWIAWLDSQMNEPSRSDWYMMRVAQRIEQSRGVGGATLDDQMVKFGRQVKSEPPIKLTKSTEYYRQKVRQAQMMHKLNPPKERGK